MRNPLLIPDESAYPAYLKGIYESLREINLKLQNEIVTKQTTIDSKELEIIELKAIIKTKQVEIEELNKKNSEIHRNNEGNRQIIKKLINDVVRKQQDVEWYKRTYESRSLLGTLKEKIFGRKGMNL